MKRQIRPEDDWTVPHLNNLHEDPQLSGKVYYSLKNGAIHFGNKHGNPVPEILIGAVGIKPNHAKLIMNDKGLFTLSVVDDEAAKNTMINGKPIPKKRTKILNHLDRIAFCGSVIFVFYYPLLNTKLKAHVEANADANEGLPINIRYD